MEGGGQALGEDLVMHPPPPQPKLSVFRFAPEEKATLGLLGSVLLEAQGT